MSFKFLVIAALLASPAAFAGERASVSGQTSGSVATHAATTPGAMGGSYSFASGAGKAQGTLSAGGMSFAAESNGIAWNQSWGGGTGTASSAGQSTVTIGERCYSVTGHGKASYSIAAQDNQGITAAAAATGKATATSGRVASITYSADALATQGLVTVDGVDLAAGTGVSVADAVAAALARVKDGE